MVSRVWWAVASVSLAGCSADGRGPSAAPIAAGSALAPAPLAPLLLAASTASASLVPEPASSADPATPRPSSTPDAGPTTGETWGEGDTDDGDCPSYRESAETRALHEPRGPRSLFSFQDYVSRVVRVERVISDKTRRHCVTVAWPPGAVNTDQREVHVAARIDDGWLRAIENTLARLPWRHLSVVRRIIIDDRPAEHGIAPFDRRNPDDARDGHTLWLHERLFEEPNHWARGNHGAYWSYHADVDGATLAGKGKDHPHFSPVLLHEVGHLVAYSLVNGRASNETVPACARVCGDSGGCKGMSDEERERGCVSAYCMPFRFETGTENWAEQYRFYYQSRATRALLEQADLPCVAVLSDGPKGLNQGRAPPWEDGLPDIAGFHKSLWKSCGEKPCKAY